MSNQKVFEILLKIFQSNEKESENKVEIKKLFYIQNIKKINDNQKF